MAILGGTTLGIGLILLVTPGPAFLVIPLGLGLLALEFAWARRWLLWARERARLERSPPRTAMDPAPSPPSREPDPPAP